MNLPIALNTDQDWAFGNFESMETSLHRQLKEIYADESSELEVPIDRFRIDVVRGGQLIEIQHGSLSAIHKKTVRLLKDHKVLVVKPIVARKQIVNLSRKGGRVLSRRMSPKRGTITHVFDELVHFTSAFPHRNLTLEVPLISIEEWRYPGHGRRRRWRERDHQVEDQQLVDIRETYRFEKADDLNAILPERLPSPFHTGHLAEAMNVKRWVAQRVAYCCRNAGLFRPAENRETPSSIVAGADSGARRLD